MEKKSSKTRFWPILVTLNILACVYPIGSDDDATRLRFLC
jgi:hypothetical protein